MTYGTYEDSLELGTPIELYEFIQGLQRWNYVSGADEILRLGQIFNPSNIKRDRIKQSNDPFKDSLKLTFTRDDPFASQFIGFSPEEVTTLTILRGHYGDPDSEFTTYWKGRVVGGRATENEVHVECESVFTSIKRPGLRAKFEYGCRHTLYLSGCGVNREAYSHIGSVLSVSGGLVVTVGGSGSYPAGYFTGGMLVTSDNVARFIVAHTGDQVTLARTVDGLVGNVTIYPGCDHLKETCNTKFANLDNFGGFPYIPARNPFDGSSIV